MLLYLFFYGGKSSGRPHYFLFICQKVKYRDENNISCSHLASTCFRRMFRAWQKKTLTFQNTSEWNMSWSGYRWPRYILSFWPSASRPTATRWSTSKPKQQLSLRPFWTKSQRWHKDGSGARGYEYTLREGAPAALTDRLLMLYVKPKPLNLWKVHEGNFQRVKSVKKCLKARRYR